MEYGNGIVGDMCIHMLDMVRWMLDLGWPKRVSSSAAASSCDKASKANITDTQTATFDFGDLQVVWQHRTWGDAARSEVSLGRDLLRRQGHAQGQRASATTSSRMAKTASRSTSDVTYELDKYPEDKTEKDLERHVRPGHPRAHAGLPGARSPRAASRWPTSSRATSRRASCILANLSMKLGRTLAWDAAAGRIAGDEEANRLLRRPYRSPWMHPEPANV